MHKLLDPKPKQRLLN